MSDLDFTICFTVTFFSKKMVNPPNLTNGKYCPHIVVKATEEHLEVNFIAVSYTHLDVYKRQV